LALRSHECQSHRSGSIARSRRETSSGIVLPDTAQEKPTKANVIAVGPGKYDDNGKLIPMPVTKGDIVLFGKYSGTEVKLDGEDYLVLRASDIIGILPQG
jgi:chaperonin GroES